MHLLKDGMKPRHFYEFRDMNKCPFDFIQFSRHSCHPFPPHLPVISTENTCYPFAVRHRKQSIEENIVTGVEEWNTKRKKIMDS